ncbi:MAG: AAA family ATPase [Clostridia bacterium]|nr:AAA family ATPase [Clostridia bacterium]
MSKLYVLVGVPASGKSTYAQEILARDAVVLSSDVIRAELLKDEARQDRNSQVFAVLYSRARKLLMNGQNVVIDATSINRFERKRILSNFEDLLLEKVAVYFDTPIELCYARDKSRSRNVGNDVINYYFNKLEVPELGEGFDRVEIVTAKENY